MLVQCSNLLLAVNYLLAVRDTRHTCPAWFYSLITPGHLIIRGTVDMQRGIYTEVSKTDKENQIGC